MDEKAGFQFEVEIDPEAAINTSFATVEIQGCLRHSLDVPIELGSNTGGRDLKLGFRITNIADRADVVFEDRSYCSDTVIRPNEKTRFLCVVPLDSLPARSFILEVDLVIEHSFWFYEKTGLKHSFLFGRPSSEGVYRLVEAPASHDVILSEEPWSHEQSNVVTDKTYTGRTHALTGRLPGAQIFLDITDLLFYLMHHRHVSGIQRVQCGYLANIVEMNDGRFRYCAQSSEGRNYFEISALTVTELLNNLNGQTFLDVESWSKYVKKIRSGFASLPAEFRRNDVLLTTGAPWVNPDYYAAIREVRKTFGVRYFQVFYDLIPTVMPETVETSLIEAFNCVVAGMLRYADYMFSISQFSADELIGLASVLGVKCPPISVIPMGGTIDYGEDRPRFQSRDSDAFPPDLLKAIGSQNYVLCVGTIEPRKNHVYLYNIWKRLISAFGPKTPKLVCVGRFGWHTEELKRYLKVTDSLNGMFVHLQNVSDETLKNLYRFCQFTVFPSLYEGWGLPVGESLYFGRVCVASDTTSIPEVGGSWATYINPNNLDDGLKVIRRLIEDKPYLREREDFLQQNYKPITWKRASEEFVEKIMGAEALASPMGEEADADVPGKSDVVAVGMNRIYNFGASVTPSSAYQQILNAIDRFSVQGLLCGADWHGFEAWGCWAQGPVARLNFRLPRDAPEKVCLYVGAWIPGYFGDRTCVISVNDHVVGQQMISCQRGRHLRVGFTKRLCEGADLKCTVELTLDRVVSSAEGGVTDPRTLGIGLKTMFFCDNDDIEARLAYLEDHIIG